MENHGRHKLHSLSHNNEVFREVDCSDKRIYENFLPEPTGKHFLENESGSTRLTLNVYESKVLHLLISFRVIKLCHYNIDII